MLNSIFVFSSEYKTGTTQIIRKTDLVHPLIWIYVFHLE